MNFSKTLFIFLILFISASFSAAQEKPAAILFDKFSGGSCDQFQARFDDILRAVYKENGSKAFVILYSEENLSEQINFFLDQITGLLPLTGFPAERITVLRVKRPGKESIEFWKVPPGAADPIPAGERWTYKLSGPLSKPFRFGNTFSEACRTFTPQAYAGFLLANPDIRGNIIVFNTTPKTRRLSREYWLDILTGKYKIPRARLRFFYRRARSFEDGSGTYPNVEFWLAPAAKSGTAKNRATGANF